MFGTFERSSIRQISFKWNTNDSKRAKKLPTSIQMLASESIMEIAHAKIKPEKLVWQKDCNR